jgi:hypothetical protein
MKKDLEDKFKLFNNNLDLRYNEAKELYGNIEKDTATLAYYINQHPDLGTTLAFNVVMGDIKELTEMISDLSSDINIFSHLWLESLQ